MTNLFIDTGVGYDDLMAITLILSQSNLNVTGFSTIFGLTQPSAGAQNLKCILNNLSDKLFPIFQGAQQSFSSTVVNFPKYDIDRATKLTLLKKLQIQTLTLKTSFPRININLLKLFSPNSTLLCLGPLTNIAQLILDKPQLFQSKVNKLIIMGGAVYRPGNVLPEYKSEYNIALDPKAAEIVFNSGINIVLISMDSVIQATANPNNQKLNPKQQKSTQAFINKVKIAKPKTFSGKLLQSIITNNDNDFNYFYDVVAASVLIDPKIIQKSSNVSISVDSKGITSPIQTPKPNVQVVTQINQQSFFQTIINSIS